MLLSLLGRPVDLDLSQVSAATAEGLERAWAQCAVPAGAVDPGDALRTRLLPPGTPREEVGPGDLVLPRLDADVTYAVSQHLTRVAIDSGAGHLLMFHAAGLLEPGSGEVVGVLAPSGTGKTTFCEVLGDRFGYVTDETLAIDPSSGEVLPYPKPLSIVGGPNRSGKADHSPVELGLDPVTGRPRLAALVVAERVSSGNTLVPTLLAEAMADAIPQTSSLFCLPDPLRALARVLTLAGGPWKLRFSNQDHCAHLLASLATSSEEPPPWSHLPGTGDGDTTLVPVDNDGLGERDRFVRAPWTDAVASEGHVILLYGRRPVTLGGAGAAVWTAAEAPLTIHGIHGQVVRALGENSRSWALVEDAVETLVARGVLEVV